LPIYAPHRDGAARRGALAPGAAVPDPRQGRRQPVLRGRARALAAGTRRHTPRRTRRRADPAYHRGAAARYHRGLDPGTNRAARRRAAASAARGERDRARVHTIGARSRGGAAPPHRGGPRRPPRVGSVIGREFTRSVLGRVVEPSLAIDEVLRELRAAGLILERRLFPEVEHAFKHALTHDVAYASVPSQERRTLHRRIAESLEAAHADRLSEMAPLLARHYSAAEDWARALDYLVRAADRAAKSFATRQALALYDEALQAAGRIPGGAPATTLMV